MGFGVGAYFFVGVPVVLRSFVGVPAVLILAPMYDWPQVSVPESSSVSYSVVQYSIQ